MRWLSIVAGFLLHKIRAVRYGAQGQLLKEGSRAPDFALPDESGSIHHLKDYLGKRVILWFYLRSRTPG